MFEDELALFDKSINEFGEKFRNSLIGNPSQVLGVRDAFRDSIRALSGIALNVQLAHFLFLHTFYCYFSGIKTCVAFVFQKSCL